MERYENVAYVSIFSEVKICLLKTKVSYSVCSNRNITLEAPYLLLFCLFLHLSLSCLSTWPQSYQITNRCSVFRLLKEKLDVGFIMIFFSCILGLLLTL